MLEAVYRINEKVLKEEIKDYFIASRSPLYIGVILPPSKGLWTHMKSGNNVVVEVNKLSTEFLIPYRIEVGENTIFFLKPNAGDGEILEQLEETIGKSRNVKKSR